MTKKFLFIILIFLIPSISFSKIIISEATYKHIGEISPKEACKKAEKRAKEKAIEQALGLQISLEERKKCTDTDGISECEVNQSSVLSLNGNITEFTILNKEDGVEEFSEPKIYFCKIQIKANVEETFKNDLNIDFDVKLNRSTFRSGEKLSMNLIFRETVYLNVYTYYPYAESYRIKKLFPNKHEKNNKISSKDLKLPIGEKLSYVISFPKNFTRSRVDEHLIFIATKQKIELLDSYFSTEDLTKRLLEIGKNNIVRKHQKTYTILND